MNVLSGPLSRAEDAASENAVRLRARLMPGEPCPVCGSEAHPVHADEHLAAIAASLRADIELAQVRLADSAAKIVGAEAKKAGAEARIANAESVDKRANAGLQLATAEYGAVLSDARTKAAELALALVFPDSLETAAEAIVTASAIVNLERKSVETALKRARSLREKIGVLTKHLSDLAGSMEKRLADKDKTRAAHNSARQAVAVEQEKLATLVDRLAVADGELAPWIEPAGVRLADLERDMPKALAKLRTSSQDWSTAFSRADSA